VREERRGPRGIFPVRKKTGTHDAETLTAHDGAPGARVIVGACVPLALCPGEFSEFWGRTGTGHHSFRVPVNFRKTFGDSDRAMSREDSERLTSC